MNNCRAGLYSFASTTTWLHKTGMASPPSLVMLGLTLPDSRILNGIASIGLTLANIAIILPYLRQPILDSMYAREGALAHEQSSQEQINIAPDWFNATQPVDLNVENPVLTSVSPCEKEHQSPPLTCSATVRPVCSAVTEPLRCLNVDAEVTPHATLLPPAGRTDDDQVPPKIYHSPDAGSGERHVSSSNLFAREGRDALYIPLPVPDAAEVAFFDTELAALFNGDLGEERPVVTCEPHAAPEEYSTAENSGPIAGKDIEHDAQLVTSDLPSTQGHVEIGEDPTDVVMPVTDEKVALIPTNVTVRDRHNPEAGSTISDVPDGLPARGGTIQSTQARHSLVGRKEVLAKRRPESLDFIPQSVIRRYPSAPTASAGHCFGHRAFGSGHDHQASPGPPHIVHNPVILLEGTKPRASYTTLEGNWHPSFLTGFHPKGRSTREQTFVIETAPIQDLLRQGPASLPEPPAPVHELASHRKYPTRRRRLGVLARAALRDRRSTANRDRIDGSSTSDSDSDFDSDSQYSSGSSADESMLPHVLGADLIAAIDANSESELNLAGSRRTMRTPIGVYEDFLVSEDSAADVSMIMHVSSNDDASDGEVRAPATFRPLNYEDIQQWASGVVQKCVRQVCRSRVPAEPSSPSQASDVCAERPSGSGVSQCPLSGLHCKLGAPALTEVPAPRTKELPVSQPPTTILPGRMPLPVRNLRDIPEFVPRQRQASMITGRVEDPRRLGMRSITGVTRDPASQVIARMESQAGFNTRQWLVGTEERRLVSTAGCRQGTLRCA